MRFHWLVQTAEIMNVLIFSANISLTITVYTHRSLIGVCTFQMFCNSFHAEFKYGRDHYKEDKVSECNREIWIKGKYAFVVILKICML